VIGGVPAGLDGPGGALASAVAGLHRRISAWPAVRSLAPTSLSGVGLVLGICAAVWFTAGTRPGNLKGALALGGGYLAALAARELADQVGGRAARAVRSRWLAVLATRLSGSAVLAGLAIGAIAQGWTAIWPLTIAVLGLVAIRDTMTACGRPTRPDASRSDASRPDAEGDGAEEGRPAADGLVHRAVGAALTMPFGGRVLLIAVAAPVWGARASLLGLLDWAIIAVGYGIGATTAARRRDKLRRQDKKPPRDKKPRRHAPYAPPEPGGLAVLLQPSRPPEWADIQAARSAGQSIPVLGMKLNRPPAGFDQAAEAELADAPRGGTRFAGRGLAEGGLADIGLADPGPADAGFADAGWTDQEFADAGFADMGIADAGFAEPGTWDGEQAAGRPAADQRPAAGLSDDRGHPIVLRCRDDGAIARWFGRLVRGNLMPLPAALLALAAVAMLAHLGLRDLPGLLILAPAIVMLVAAPGSSHPHAGRFDWLVPAVLQGAQYIYIAALGFAAGVPAPLTFVLCAAIALRYADLGCEGSPVLPGRRRAASAAPDQPAAGQLVPEQGTWMGWEGRMIICGLGAAMGIAMFAYVALAAYVGGLVCWKIMTSGLGLREGDCW